MFEDLVGEFRGMPVAQRRKALDRLLHVISVLLEEDQALQPPPKHPGSGHEFCAQCPFLKKN